MPNSWYKRAIFRNIIAGLFRLKKSMNMFERMIIAEIIYEGVVKSSYLKTAPAEANHTRLSR